MEVEGGEEREEEEEDSSPDKKKSSKNTVEVVDKSQIVPPINFEEMTEEEQMSYALQMSVDQGLLFF